MYIKAQPLGVTQLSNEDRMPLWRVISGDDWRLTTTLLIGGVPATPKNSRVYFALSETRFSWKPYWVGRWAAGVESINQFGLVEIRVPDHISAKLRRGAYRFSIAVQDTMGTAQQTELAGTIQVEYEPTSPNHSIPYRGCQLGEYVFDPARYFPRPPPWPLYPGPNYAPGTVLCLSDNIPAPIGEPAE